MALPSLTSNKSYNSTVAVSPKNECAISPHNVKTQETRKTADYNSFDMPRLSFELLSATTSQLLPSKRWACMFQWCLLPRRWLSRSDLDEQLALQMMHFHIEAGFWFLSSWDALFSCGFASISLPSLCWFSTFFRCLLPWRWLSRSDLDVQFALQMPHFHLDTGFWFLSASWGAFFSCSFASISLPSLCWFSVSSWCLLPLRWLCTSVSRWHVTLQMLQTHNKVSAVRFLLTPESVFVCSPACLMMGFLLATKNCMPA